MSVCVKVVCEEEGEKGGKRELQTSNRKSRDAACACLDSKEAEMRRECARRHGGQGGAIYLRRRRGEGERGGKEEGERGQRTSTRSSPTAPADTSDGSDRFVTSPSEQGGEAAHTGLSSHLMRG